MTAEDLAHLRALLRTARSSADHFASFAEVCGANCRWRYDAELFHILTAEVIESVHGAARDAECLPGTNLKRRAVDCPGKTPAIPQRTSYAAFWWAGAANFPPSGT